MTFYSLIEGSVRGRGSVAVKQDVLLMSSKENIEPKEGKRPRIIENGLIEETTERSAKLHNEEKMKPREEKRPEVIRDGLLEETIERLVKLHYEFRLNSPEILERIEKGRARAKVSFFKESISAS